MPILSLITLRWSTSVGFNIKIRQQANAILEKNIWRLIHSNTDEKKFHDINKKPGGM
jgi:hypothetical protein